jgi:hypothetical protein
LACRVPEYLMTNGAASPRVERRLAAVHPWQPAVPLPRETSTDRPHRHGTTARWRSKWKRRRRRRRVCVAGAGSAVALGQAGLADLRPRAADVDAHGHKPGSSTNIVTGRSASCSTPAASPSSQTACERGLGRHGGAPRSANGTNLASVIAPVHDPSRGATSAPRRGQLAHCTSTTAGALSSKVPAVVITTLWNSTLPVKNGGMAGIGKLPKPPGVVAVR